ncbi:MAG: hypothetical protein ABH816_04125 [Candidatus Levyibacteriota bacterium]
MIKNILGGSLETIKEEGIESIKTAGSQITGKQKYQAAGQKTQAQQKQVASNKQQGQKGFGGAVQTAVGISPKSAPGKSELPQKPIEQTQETKDVVKHLYGGEKPEIPKEQIAQKEIEDKQKEEALKQRLHGEYYHKLTTPQRQAEEKPAEKVEREKMEELQEEKEKKAKGVPELVKQKKQRVEVPIGAG